MSIHDDCRYWRLTPGQCFRYHVRLARRFAAGATKLVDARVTHQVPTPR